VSTDLPSEISSAVTRTALSKINRSVKVVLARVLGPSGIEAYSEMLRYYQPGTADAEFERLPADADEQTRRELVQRLLPSIRAVHAEHPDLMDRTVDTPRGEQFALRTVGVAVSDLYNPAQIDVMVHVGRELQPPPGSGRT